MLSQVTSASTNGTPFRMNYSKSCGQWKTVGTIAVINGVWIAPLAAVAVITDANIAKTTDRQTRDAQTHVADLGRAAAVKQAEYASTLVPAVARVAIAPENAVKQH